MASAEVQDLYTQARKLALAASSTITNLERTGQQLGPTEQRQQLQGRLSTAQKQLEQLRRICQELEGRHALWQSSGNARNALVWEKKLHQLLEESAALERSLDTCRAMSARVGQEEAQRQELLQRRKQLGAGRNGAMDVETADLEAKERIRRSKQVAEEAYQTGVVTLAAMAGQRDVLKNAHRKVLDVLNTVGMSDSVLRIAERRISVDKLIAYGGMLLVTLLVVAWLVLYAR